MRIHLYNIFSYTMLVKFLGGVLALCKIILPKLFMGKYIPKLQQKLLGKYVEYFKQTLSLATQAGEKQRVAQYTMGLFFEYGFLVKPNPKRAFYWYLLAGGNKQNDSFAFAFPKLGLCYFYGRGVAKDYQKALEYLTIASTTRYLNEIIDVSKEFVIAHRSIYGNNNQRGL